MAVQRTGTRRMNSNCSLTARDAAPLAVLAEAKVHLVTALKLIDVASPSSVLGARCQHLIDDIDARLAGTGR